MKIEIKKVLDAVCEYHLLEPSTIFKDSRKSDLVNIRQQFHYLAYKHTNKSYESIGKISKQYRGKPHDHATVRSSMKRIEDLLTCDKAVQRDIAGIFDILKKDIDLVFLENELLFKRELESIQERLIQIEQKLTA